MWGALLRQVVAFVLTKRGKKIITFVAAMALCFVAILLVDLRLYLTAAFTGLLAAATLASWLVQLWRQRRRKHERDQRETEKATRRAANTQARGERIDKAKIAVAGAARTVGDGAADVMDVAKTRLSRARDGLRFWRKKRSSDET